MRHCPNILSIGFALVSKFFSAQAFTELKTYEVDPTHTFPTFEADHMGLTMWRGKINSTKGIITLDREAQIGSVDITMDMDSIDFGLDDMNKHAKSDDMLDVEKYPEARYVGELIFSEDMPVKVDGNLTLHGITKSVTLEIKSFKCILHPTKYVDSCGAEATASINREDFGIDYAKNYGFKMDVALRIGIEASEIQAKKKVLRVFYD